MRRVKNEDAPFRVLSPKSLDEALTMSRELSESGEEFDWVAGGTDLLPNYKWHINVKGHVISLSSIAELREISEESMALWSVSMS